MVTTGLLVLGWVGPVRGLAMWQASDSINSGHAILLEVFVGLVALALTVQAVVVVIAAVAGMKAQKAIMGHVLEIKAKALPIMEKSHTLLADLSPKVSAITANVEHISFVVREKVVEFEPTISAVNVTVQEANETVRDANAKTHAQVVRVNGMITSALTATSELAEKIHTGIQGPVREITGIVSGVKAGLDTLISKARGFGQQSVKASGFRTGSVETEYGARPASSVVRPPSSAGLQVVAAPPASVEAATAVAAFRRAEEKI